MADISYFIGYVQIRPPYTRTDPIYMETPPDAPGGGRDPKFLPRGNQLGMADISYFIGHVQIWPPSTPIDPISNGNAP